MRHTSLHPTQGCSGDERQLADKLAPVISPGREPVKITEGGESEHFWDSLGGKAEYASGKWLSEVVPTYPPRLFQCSNATGRFVVEEIFDFAQEVRILLPFVHGKGPAAWDSAAVTAVGHFYLPSSVVMPACQLLY